MTVPLLCQRIASRLECVAPLGEKVRAVCVELGLSSAAAAEVELAVVEVVNNAIEHGYHRAGSGWVQVSVASQGGQLHIEVSDGGQCMPPDTLALSAMPLVDPSDRDSLPEGGMGLAIVKQLMDDVRYASAPGRNVLTMERRLGRASLTASEGADESRG